MDVFDYFKRARQIRESSTSDRAHELGYEYQSRGVWLDPKTEKRYRAKGVNFTEIPQKEVSTRQPKAKEDSPQPQQQQQTLGDFKKKATVRKDLVNKSQQDAEIDPEFEAENRAKAMARGMWPNLPEKNKEQAIARQKASMAMDMSAEEPIEEPIEEPAPEPEEKAPSPKQQEFDAALAAADEEEDETGGALDDLLGDIRGGSKSKPSPKKPKATKAGGSSFQSLSDTFNQMVESGALNNKKGELSNAKYRELYERLQDPVVQEVANEFMNAYDELYSDENVQNFNETGSNIGGSDDAISFMENTLGMVRNKRGKLTFGETTPGQNIAMGDAPAAGAGFREYRGLNFHERQALKDPKVRDILENIIGGTAQPETTYQNRRDFQRGYLKNNVSTKDAREVYDQLDRKVQTALDGMGQPENALGIFDPAPGTELKYFEDADGMSGDTDLDMMMTDPETRDEFLSNFSTKRPGRERGVMILQRLLNTGFIDQSTGLPFFGGLRSVTADHIVGRRSATGDPLDYPMNLALVSRNINQFKSGNSEQYGDDSFNKVLNTPDNNPFDKVFDDPKMAWMANRLLDSHFDSKRLQKALGTEIDTTGSDAVFPVEQSSLSDIASSDIENMMKSGGANNPLGLNIANLSKMPPRPNDKGEQNLGKNTWRGGSGFGYDRTQEFLDGYRKSMLSSIMQNEDLRTEIETITKEMEGQNQKKIDEAIRVARVKHAEKEHGIPMRAMSSVYGLGRISNDEMVDWFRKRGMSNIEHLKESDPELYNQLSKEINTGMDKWRGKLQKLVRGDRPYEFGPNDPKFLNAIDDEGGKAIMRDPEARKYLTKEEIDEFYKKVKNPDKWKQEFGESFKLTNPNKRGTIERLKKTLRDPLNGKTSIQMDRR